MNNNMTEQKIEQYSKMSKAFMNIPIDPDRIVGNYGWHEKFPYERYLLTRPNKETETVVKVANELYSFVLDKGVENGSK